LKNPHHSFDGDFLLYIGFSFAAPIMSKAIVLQFSWINTKTCGATKITHKY
jgi:hypothetical protein